MTDRLPTLKDVAKRAGVSLGTASSALAGLGSVRARTRERVLAAAQELGYQRNAAAAVMAAGRRRARITERPISLGYLQSPQAEEPQPMAFAQRAKELGYDVEWIRLWEYQAGAEASRVLYFRNVAGLFYSSPGAVPEDEQWTRSFDWGKFAVVKFSRARPELKFPLIRHSAFDYTVRAMKEVFARGYRKVAVLLTPSKSPQDDHARLGAALGWQALRTLSDAQVHWRLLPELPEQGLDKATISWVKKCGPEAVVGFPDVLYWRLRECGFKIPGDFAFAGIVGKGGDEQVATCTGNLDHVRRQAVQMLHQMILTRQLGMSDSPREVVIEPDWQPGASLPPRKLKKSKR